MRKLFVIGLILTATSYARANAASAKAEACRDYVCADENTVSCESISNKAALPIEADLGFTVNKNGYTFMIVCSNPNSDLRVLVSTFKQRKAFIMRKDESGRAFYFEIDGESSEYYNASRKNPILQLNSQFFIEPQNPGTCHFQTSFSLTHKERSKALKKDYQKDLENLVNSGFFEQEFDCLAKYSNTAGLE